MLQHFLRKPPFQDGSLLQQARSSGAVKAGSPVKTSPTKMLLLKTSQESGRNIDGKFILFSYLIPFLSEEYFTHLV